MRIPRLDHLEIKVSVALLAGWGLWLGWTSGREGARYHDLAQRMRKIERLVMDQSRPIPMPSTVRVYGEQPAINAWDADTLTSGAVAWYD